MIRDDVRAGGGNSTTRRRKVLRDVRGTSTIEYGLILAMIVLTMFAGLLQLGTETKKMWHDVSSRMVSAR